MSNPNDMNEDDTEIAGLLRSAGTRIDPPADVMRDVQAAVHAEWRQVVAQRQRRRTFVWAAAASVCAIAAGATISVGLLNNSGEPVATLQRSAGDIFVASDGTHWSRLDAGARIAVGDSVRTDGPAALQLDNGLALRVDRGTTLKVLDADRFALNAGAIYVDAHPGTATEAFVVTTNAGSVRHLGTQYQVRMQVDGIDVSVREGRVVFESERDSTIAEAGERLEISNTGSVQRSTIAATDQQWAWTSAVAPSFAIENASLADFLDYMSRETGRALIYASPRVEATAASVTLHGSIDGLAPDVALSAVLATTPLRQDQTKAEVIEIAFANAIDPAPNARPTP